VQYVSRMQIRVAARMPIRLLGSLPLLALALLAIPVAARAQSVGGVLQPSVPQRGPDPDSLLLRDVLEVVQRTHPRLDVARAAARAAGARVPGVRRPPDPVLQLGWMNYELFSLKPMDGIGMTQLQLMQMLPLGGKLRLAGLAESARADASGVRVSAVSSDLRAQAAMVFYDLYATDGALRTAIASRRLLRDIAAITSRMYEVGEGRQADVLRANVEVARMDEEVIRMEAMRDAMAARLNALLGRRHDAPVGTPRLPAFPSAVPVLDSLAGTADRQRPMLRALALELDAATAASRLAAREIWPDLQVGLQYGQQPGPNGAQRMGSLMIGASLPVFAGQRQHQMREEANAMRAMASADLAAMRAESHGALGEAFASLGRARRLAAFYRASVLPQADAAVASASSAYRAGTVDFMTLLEAQMTRNRYAQELFTLEADEGKAWAELEMLTGSVLVDTNTAATVRPAGGAQR